MKLETLVKNTLNFLRKRYPAAVESDLEDAVQAALVRFLEIHGSLDAITPNWLRLAAYRKWIDAMRRNRRAIPTAFLGESLLADDAHVVWTDVSLDSSREDVKEAADELRWEGNNEGTSCD